MSPFQIIKTIVIWAFFAGMVFAGYKQMQGLTESLNRRMVSVEQEVARLNREGTTASGRQLKAEHDLLLAMDKRVQLLEVSNAQMAVALGEIRTDLKWLVRQREKEGGR